MIAELFCGLNDKRLVSANILTDGDVTVEEAEGKRIIVVRVPRASGESYPVYINGDPVNGIYFRLGEADHRINSASLSAEQLAEIDSIRKEK
jgi:hypothetical protein